MHNTEIACRILDAVERVPPKAVLDGFAVAVLSLFATLDMPRQEQLHAYDIWSTTVRDLLEESPPTRGAPHLLQ